MSNDLKYIPVNRRENVGYITFGKILDASSECPGDRVVYVPRRDMSHLADELAVTAPYGMRGQVVTPSTIVLRDLSRGRHLLIVGSDIEPYTLEVVER